MRWPAVAGRTLRDSGSSGSEAMTEIVGRDFVEFAHLLADAAGGIVVPAIRSRRVVHRKADASPVTEVDRAVETRLREMIAARFPDHGVVGEEFGGERLDAEHVWVLDPVDGTKAFMAGLPVYGTLIGLARGGRPVLGIVDQPVMRERWTGIDGDGTRRNGERVHTNACGRLSDALVCTTSHEYYEGEDALALRRIVSGSGWMVYGGNCLAFAQVAGGFVDVAFEARVGVYDYCALVPVIENAGGVMTGWRGEPLTLEPTPGGRILASGNRMVHEAAMACLAGEG